MRAGVFAAPAATGGWLLGVLAGGILIAVVASQSLSDPHSYRLMLAVLAIVGFGVLGWVRPRAAILGVLAFLSVLALLRRLLIPVAGWSAWDPLITVGPAVVAFLFARQLAASGGRGLAPDLLSRLVLALLLLTGLQTLNPANGGIQVGLTGLLYFGVPLVWFFVGRYLADRPTVRILLVGFGALACAEAAYGLWQASFGLPSWDAAWFSINGYSALRVEDALRPFGTFSSSAEFAACLGMGIALAVASALHGLRSPLLAVPVLAWSLVVASVRFPLALTGIAVLAMGSLRLRRGWPAGAVLAAGLVAVVLTGQRLGDALEAGAVSTSDPLVAHQVSGIVHPYDSSSSTLILHTGLVEEGIAASLRSPLGLGTGHTNAAAKLGTSGFTTEMDVSDAFVSLGPLGGLLFVLVIVTVFANVTRLYWRRQDPLVLAVGGMLVVALGQWLNGGFYLVSAVVWLLIGWTARLGHETQDALEPRLHLDTHPHAALPVPAGGGLR